MFRFVFQPSLIALRFLFNHPIISIFFIPLLNSVLVTPVLFGTAKVEIFFYLSSFLFSFFLPVLLNFHSAKPKETKLLYNLSNTPSH